jgi:tetratricopeptide (TPR) repeat protein
METATLPPRESGATDTGALYATGLTDTEKVQLAIDRKKEVRTIRKGDYMTLKNNPEQAIAYYSAALEQLPDDIVIRRKIAHAYYLTRNWQDAYTNYARVPIWELREDEYNELFTSLFFDDARPDRLTELARYQIDIPTREYYQMIDTCYSGIHNCIVTIEAYTGSSTRILDLQNSIRQSTQISPDYQYRNFLVAAELYRQGSYRAVDILATEILSKRPNYSEVRKLAGFALYELGRYSDARDILLAYLESNPQDLESISRLGEIYVYLGDYATSSLYLNNAVTAGYPHKTELERRLAYNYAALGDHAGMLKVLSYLLQESDVTEDDYAVAVSLALRQGENIRAYAWSYASIELYPNSPILIPLYLSALRLNGKSAEIPDYIHSLTDELAANPLIQLEYATSMLDTGKIEQALPIFTAIRDQDPTSDWGIEAASQIRAIAWLHNQTESVQ